MCLPRPSSERTGGSGGASRMATAQGGGAGRSAGRALSMAKQARCCFTGWLHLNSLHAAAGCWATLATSAGLVGGKAPPTGNTRRLLWPRPLSRRLKMLFGLAGLPPTGELHGDMTQAARLESLERFRKVGGAGICARCTFSSSVLSSRGGQFCRLVEPALVPAALPPLWCRSEELRVSRRHPGVLHAHPLSPTPTFAAAPPTAGGGGFPAGHGCGCSRPGHPGRGDGDQL